MTTAAKILSHADRAARRKQIAQAVKDGTRRHDAALQFGVCVGTVDDACREHNIECRDVGGPVGMRTLRVLRDLICGDGPTFTAIGERHGLSRQRVASIFAAATAAQIPMRFRP